MLFEVVTIDLHYTDRHERFDLKISKLRLLFSEIKDTYILDALEVS